MRPGRARRRLQQRGHQGLPAETQRRPRRVGRRPRADRPRQRRPQRPAARRRVPGRGRAPLRTGRPDPAARQDARRHQRRAARGQRLRRQRRDDDGDALRPARAGHRQRAALRADEPAPRPEPQRPGGGAFELVRARFADAHPFREPTLLPLLRPHRGRGARHGHPPAPAGRALPARRPRVGHSPRRRGERAAPLPRPVHPGPEPAAALLQRARRRDAGPRRRRRAAAVRGHHRAAPRRRGTAPREAEARARRGPHRRGPGAHRPGPPDPLGQPHDQRMVRPGRAGRRPPLPRSLLPARHEVRSPARPSNVSPPPSTARRKSS